MPSGCTIIDVLPLLSIQNKTFHSEMAVHTVAIKQRMLRSCYALVVYYADEDRVSELPHTR
jgi:hypothetical protein